MEKNTEIVIFWFRRDLRLMDNTGLIQALHSGYPVIPLFIFDEDILNELPKNDARVSFIYQSLINIHLQLKKYQSSLVIKRGHVATVFDELIAKYRIKKVFYNNDYEPYALDRDQKITTQLAQHNIQVQGFKDQVLFEKDELLKDNGTPYTVYTPYKNKWLKALIPERHAVKPLAQQPTKNFLAFETLAPSLESLGFIKSKLTVRPPQLNDLNEYELHRDFPAQRGTSYVSPHLRFGTISIRAVVSLAINTNSTYLNELIWREFFMQILAHYPHVVTRNFKPAYDGIIWRDAPEDFERWCSGTTGYPLVDAGMRQLNQTGYMHNRVRMVTASFLCKHLLIDWRLGEAYFAEKLLDYELSSNNGNWQWAAGTGCDAAPYFRIFNPTLQLNKFDKELSYVQQWIPEYKTNYIPPMVDHKFARTRALETYKRGIKR